MADACCSSRALPPGAPVCSQQHVRGCALSTTTAASQHAQPPGPHLLVHLCVC
jgi:hypothetical protein